MIKLDWINPGASDDDLTINVVKESAFSEVGALVKSQFSSFAGELDKLFATQSWNIRGHHITNPTNSEFIREISQNRHTFAALFDPPKMRNLMAPAHVVSKKKLLKPGRLPLGSVNAPVCCNSGTILAKSIIRERLGKHLENMGWWPSLVKELELINYWETWKTLDWFLLLVWSNGMQVYICKTMATPLVLVLPDPENQ